MPPSTTAPGPNGAATPRCPSKRGRRGRRLRDNDAPKPRRSGDGSDPRVTPSTIQRLQHLVEAGEVGAPLGLVGGDLGQAVDDGAALLQQLARLGGIVD